jgi:hypothetical protein
MDVPILCLKPLDGSLEPLHLLLDHSLGFRLDDGARGIDPLDILPAARFAFFTLLLLLLFLAD